MTHSTRRDFVAGTLAAGAALTSPSLAHSAPDRRSIYKEIARLNRQQQKIGFAGRTRDFQIVLKV